MSDIKRCCFCNKVITGWGNNPSPVVTDPNKECCDECNWNVVVPARIVALAENKEDSNGKETP